MSFQQQLSTYIRKDDLASFKEYIDNIAKRKISFTSSKKHPYWKIFEKQLFDAIIKLTFPFDKIRDYLSYLVEKLCAPDDEFSYPLTQAILYHKMEIFEFLLQHGGISVQGVLHFLLNNHTDLDDSFKNCLLQYHPTIVDQIHDGQTPLFYAISNNIPRFDPKYIDKIKYLLQHGADWTIPSQLSHTGQRMTPREYLLSTTKAHPSIREAISIIEQAEKQLLLIKKRKLQQLARLKTISKSNGIDASGQQQQTLTTTRSSGGGGATSRQQQQTLTTRSSGSSGGGVAATRQQQQRLRAVIQYLTDTNKKDGRGAIDALFTQFMQY